MKGLLLLAALIFSAGAYPIDLKEIERLTPQCEREKSSHFRNPRTPICDRLDVMLREQERLKDVPEDQAVSKQWRGGMHCAVNKYNVPLYCY
jgi:hypothetical protein